MSNARLLGILFRTCSHGKSAKELGRDSSSGSAAGAGWISASVVDPTDVVREACVHHAGRVVLVHNHPSGECDPSKEDIDTTNKITQALKYVGIRVLDHIIVGRARQDCFSFARAGMV